ncbi:TerC family protein [Luteimonas sp. MC1825]|uniref:TerC family protein n=1 Tax=Luteimonas sp. MC1825 TaxID=2761107 RepID=UPI0016202036|nr:TerC family protein [Luteimonas sp. MC1825]MBB6600272.1 TerC family protein [Luteimonas sp. MC1825]QOC87954.1 TerC family protein [Luteimonas sp. MC1825]
MPTTSPLVWEATIALIVALLAFDYFFHVRKAHAPSLREAAVWSALYVGIALLFGAGVWYWGGATMGAEYFSGYVTEKALSVDNIFVFLVIMASFKVPREDQQKVLLFGITFALIARTVFILLGAALIERFSWVFYLFGLALLLTAGNLLKPQHHGEEDEKPNIVVRLVRKVFHSSPHYDGDKLFTTWQGKRALTPMLLVMLAIGGTDILFAFDSIPAIFGLTQNIYIVFTATAFSLLGLRQLYFLVGGLLERLVYLSLGLAAVLGFIGVKLVLHALHENNLPFINDGDPVPVIEISTGLSLVVIVGLLVVTVLASLLSPKGRAKAAVTELRRHVGDYLALGDDAPAAERARLHAQVVAAEARVHALEPRFKAMITHPKRLQHDVERVHAAQRG